MKSGANGVFLFFYILQEVTQVSGAYNKKQNQVNSLSWKSISDHPSSLKKCHAMQSMLLHSYI